MPPSSEAPDARPAYPLALLPRLQSLLAALADIECGFDSDVETVEASAIPGALKQAVIESLRQRHQERRALIVQHLDDLQRQVLRASDAAASWTRPAAAETGPDCTDARRHR
ncbi:MAG: hypothetical protein M3158_09715 [Pseudomonadota bacterium]|nr:hypothetical protein [Pseudomonadota bacterium]